LLACDVDVILEKELQRQLSQPLRLRHRRRENAEDDDQPQRKQIALVDFCPRAGGLAHISSICILSGVYANRKTCGFMRLIGHLVPRLDEPTPVVADQIAEPVRAVDCGIMDDSGNIAGTQRSRRDHAGLSLVDILPVRGGSR
jgi:hypothetical protein